MNHRNSPVRASVIVETLEFRCLLSGKPILAHSTLAKHHAPGNVVQPLYTTPQPWMLTPSQVRHAYGVDLISFSGGTITGDGSGQTVAIVDAFDDPKFVSTGNASFSTSDLHKFDVQFGLPDPPSFLKVDQNGGTSYPVGNTGWGSEIAMDVEWVHAMAPAANIILVEATNNSLDNLMAAVDWARNQPGVCAISMSFGTNEFSGQSFYDSFFTTPGGHNGVTFVASTGDSGAPGGYPAFSPNVLAIGGTTLTLSGGNYSNENGWSGSGGGISTQTSKPSYQFNVTQSATQRTIPDVGFDGDPNSSVAVYDSYANGTLSPWGGYAGTSLSAPCWAGLVSIINQGRTINSQPVYDGMSLATALYQLPSGDYHDIVAGNNGFAAGAGYDLVTGIGSPRANLLVNDLIGAPQPPQSPTNLDLSTSSDSGNSNSDNITNDSTPTFTGNALPGTTIKLYADANQVGTATTSGGGTWTITTSALADATYGITATATNANGTSPLSGSMNITIDTVAPAMPTTPDLVVGNDSGKSNSDNITNVTTPTFVGSADVGSLVTIYANSVQVASGTTSTGSYNLHVLSPLSNGVKSITATASDTAGNISNVTSGLTVTIDTVAPTLSTSAFSYLTSQKLDFTFSENVAWSVNPYSLDLMNTADSNSLDAGNFAESYSSGTNTATFTFPGYSGMLPDANYRATIGAVRDVAGNGILSDPTMTFFVLAGDANRDQAVDTTDFNILAANFSQSGKNFGDGDFNYDGSVDTTDFNILAANFSKSLPASPAAAAAAPSSGASPALGSTATTSFSQTRIDQESVVDLI